VGSRVFLSCVVLALAAAPFAHATSRDDTAWLQAKLDAGGNIFLPKLPNGECYETRGLWLTRDDTSITSDGACIVATGPGESRLTTAGGKPIRSTSVFRLDQANKFAGLPLRVTIANLDIRVPAKTHMDGVVVYGGETTLDHLAIGGAPRTDVVVGRGMTASAGPVERIILTGCKLAGAWRDAVSVSGPIGLRVEDDTITGAHGAGLDVRAADRGQPVLDVHVIGNAIVKNAGGGIRIDLAPADGAPVLADGLEITGNRVSGNGAAGILVAGGQEDGTGQLVLSNNIVRSNRGPGVRGREVLLRIASDGNDLRGNRGGPTRGLTEVSATPNTTPSPWTPPSSALAPTSGRDDTSWLQSRLDQRGETIFLPKLPGGECYATHGLWVSHDDTTITSDGACIVALGPGEVRLHSGDGDPIPASAVFYVSHSNAKLPAPVRVTVSNLRIVVPAGLDMYGVAVFAHRVTLNGLDIGGFPKDDVIIGARGTGTSFAGRVSVLGSTLSGAMRNAITAFGVIGLDIENDTIQGVRNLPTGQPAAGIDIEPDYRDQPTLDVRIVHNTIQDNAGSGILLPLDTNGGPSVIASGFVISGNMIARNCRQETPAVRAGIAISGGQDGGEGTLALTNNVIRDNGGPGVWTNQLKLVLQQSGNELIDNRG
jgi:parallel beta helix pectate lyase-like protein